MTESMPTEPGHSLDAVVVHESMFGNTRAIAEAVAAGLSTQLRARAVPVGEAGSLDLRELALLVVGGPTHAWGMSRPGTRRSAVEQAAKPGSGLVLEPAAAGNGVREWLATLHEVPPRAAAFDTRLRAPLGLSGSAARAIDRVLRRLGALRAARPEGFHVSKQNTLVDGELARARAWGARMASPRARSTQQS
jgi:hypothetical protein